MKVIEKQCIKDFCRGRRGRGDGGGGGGDKMEESDLKLFHCVSHNTGHSSTVLQRRRQNRVQIVSSRRRVGPTQIGRASCRERV